MFFSGLSESSIFLGILSAEESRNPGFEFLMPTLEVFTVIILFKSYFISKIIDFTSNDLSLFWFSLTFMISFLSFISIFSSTFPFKAL